MHGKGRIRDGERKGEKEEGKHTYIVIEKKSG